jgi:PAS domain S-box-containing protein
MANAIPPPATLWTHFLRRLRRTTQFLHSGDAQFRQVAETIPQIVWTATPGAGFDYCNHRWYELTGLSAEQTMGTGWQDAFHPDDLPVALANWEKGHRDGTPIDAEYRLRTREGSYRWHLIRATPLLDGNRNVIRRFGTCTDMQNQMHAQEVLEEQIKQHTAALMEANARLEAEMKERALTQQELDRQNERTVKELTRRTMRATTLAKLAELLQSCAEQKDVVSVAAGMAPRVFPDFRGAVLLLNSSRKMLEVAAQWGDCILPADVFEPQDCWALRTGHLHYVPPHDPMARCAHTANLDSSSLCVPLLSQGEATGVLHFETILPGEMGESEKSLASTFADQVGLSVANLRLRDALRNESIRDPLTGLHNRRTWKKRWSAKPAARSAPSTASVS